MPAPEYHVATAQCSDRNGEKEQMQVCYYTPRHDSNMGHAEPEREDVALSVPKIEPSEPPDGGLQAWVQVLAAHLVQFNTWGMANSFGVFEEYYVRIDLESKSNLAWIGSLQIFLVFLIGTFSGRALDFGYAKLTLFIGAILQVLGVFLASISTNYWQLLLTQGVLNGLGNGLVFCPIISLVSTFFTTKRSLAIGLVTSGACTGGIVIPLVARELLLPIGFPWTMRIIGFIMLFNWAVALALFRNRTPPRRTGPLVDLASFKDKGYCWYCIGSFLNLLSAYFAYYYFGTFATSVIGVSSETAFLLLLIMNGVGIVGRVLSGWVADKYFGALNTYIPISIVGGITFYAWAGVCSVSGLYVFSVFYGIIGAAVQGMFLACLASLTTDLSKIGTRTGMVFTIISISSLTGAPLAGRLIEIDNGGYLYAQMFGGSVLIAGAVALTLARTAKSGWVLRMKL